MMIHLEEELDDYDEYYDEELEEDDNDDDCIEELAHRSKIWLDQHSEENKLYSDKSPQVPIMLSGKELEELSSGTISRELFNKIQLKREITCAHKMNDDSTWHAIQDEIKNINTKIKYKIKHKGIYV